MDQAPRDVLIVGAGIIGIACAHYLSLAGYKITVVDQGRVGGGCSHGNCGLVCPSHVLPLAEPAALVEGFLSFFNPLAAFRLKLQPRWSLYRWMWGFTKCCTRGQMIAGGRKLQPLMESTLKQYQQLFTELGPFGEWKEKGILHLYKTEKELEKFAAVDALLTDNYGISARRIESVDLPAFDPSLKEDLAGAYYYPEDAWVRPDALTREWSSLLMQRGVEFLENCRVEGVERSAGGIAGLLTPEGKLTARRYVFAAGAWSAALTEQLGCRIPVEPGKGYSMTVRKSALAPRQPVMLSEHKVFLTPFDNGYRVGSMMEFTGFDNSIPAHRMQQLRDATLPYLNEPAPEGDMIEEQWCGWRPMTWDSLPIIGRVPGMNNALLATGHNMLGVTLAPATGRLLAELVDERKPHVDAEAFSPERFQ